MFKALCILALAAPVAFAVQCTISGDPHYVLFDNTYHDFMGVGVFQLAKNRYVNVQAQMVYCGVHPATCIRSVTVAFHNVADPNQAPDVFTYGVWGTGDPIYLNKAVQDKAAARANGIVGPNSGAVLRFTVGETVMISNNYGSFKFSVTIGYAYALIDMPLLEGFMYSTFGLCGYFDGAAANDFSDANRQVALTAAAGNRYNGANVNQWGLDFAVTAAGPITPLAHAYYAQSSEPNTGTMSTQRFEFQADPPTPAVPTPAQQLNLTNIGFKDITFLAAVQAQCQKICFGNDIAYENCVYDAALVGAADFALAASNGQSARTQQEIQLENGERSALITKEESIILGVVFGVIAAVAIVVALVLYCRVRKLSYDYSRALITRDQATGGRSAAQGGAARADINLADNV